MEIKDQRSKLSFDELIERCGNAKVLVVDDKQENIQVVGTLLKSLSWIRLYVALSGQKALEATMESRPDLILLDLNIVDMDGLETLKRLRDLEALEFATVIFLTADQGRKIAWKVYLLAVLIIFKNLLIRKNFLLRSRTI